MCIADGFCHTAVSKPRANYEERRPMQRYLLSKAATLLPAAILPAACGPIYSHCAFRPASISALAPIIACSNHHVDHKMPQSGCSAANRPKWLMRASNHNIMPPDSRIRRSRGFTGRYRYHHVRLVETNVMLRRYPREGVDRKMSRRKEQRDENGSPRYG